MPSLGGINSAVGYGTTGLSVAGTVAASTVTAGTAATGATAGIIAAGSAATIVGLVAVPIMILVAKLFKGADPRQVPASQIEQTFEAGAISLLAIGRAGMLSRSEAQAGMRVFLQKGEEFFNSAPELRDKRGSFIRAGTAGLSNMRMVINAQISSAESGGGIPGGPAVATARTRALDLAAARALYTSRNQLGKKWYAESLAASDRLVDEFLSRLPSDPIAAKAVSLAQDTVGFLKTPLGLGVGALTLIAGLVFGGRK